MYVTYPMTLAHDEIWIFCEYDDTHQVDAFRLAINVDSGEYITYSPDHIVTDALIPVRRDTHEPVSDLVGWATVHHLHANPVFPGWRYTERPT
jgi:hypothetical protein